MVVIYDYKITMNRTPQKLLIIEDHKDSCLWISSVMRQYGYTTLEASDGTLGMQLARREKPDVILLDIHLPAGSGYFVLENLKKLEDTRSIPVIIMTGDLGLDTEELKRQGAAAIFTKPMDVSEFVRTIKAVVHNYRTTTLFLPA